MPITGYGEDALCYWALSCQMGEVLRQLKDQGPVFVTLYRPSFGRRGSSPKKPSSQFGEFDAIIVTSTRIYLVEAKWRYSSEIRGGKIELRKEQTRRHKVFAKYLEAWWGTKEPGDWDTFRKRAGEKFTVDQLDYPIPEKKRKLAKNLMAVLYRLGKEPKDIQDVLLYLALDGEKKIPSEKPEKFELVTIHTGSADGFVELPCMG